MRGASGGREEEGSKKSIPNIHIRLAFLTRGAQNHTHRETESIVSGIYCESMLVCLRTASPATSVSAIELQSASSGAWMLLRSANRKRPIVLSLKPRSCGMGRLDCHFGTV